MWGISNVVWALQTKQSRPSPRDRAIVIRTLCGGWCSSPLRGTSPVLSSPSDVLD